MTQDSSGYFVLIWKLRIVLECFNNLGHILFRFRWYLIDLLSKFCCYITKFMEEIDFYYFFKTKKKPLDIENSGQIMIFFDLTSGDL